MTRCTSSDSDSVAATVTPTPTPTTTTTSRERTQISFLTCKKQHVIDKQTSGEPYSAIYGYDETVDFFCGIKQGDIPGFLAVNQSDFKKKRGRKTSFGTFTLAGAYILRVFQ